MAIAQSPLLPQEDRAIMLVHIMSRLILILVMAFASLAPSHAIIVDIKAPKVYFISPLDNAQLKSPFIVRFGLSNWGVAPAGVSRANIRTGHHHLLINSDPPPLGEAIIQDDYHRHYGAGQTEDLIHLVAGTYKLRLVLGDHNHYPIQGLVSDVRTVIVVPDDE